MAKPAVLFDIDGTLVDSNYLHVHAWQQAFHEVGLPVQAWHVHRSIGMDGSALVEELSDGADDDVQQRLKGRTPAEVARFLAPPDVELDDVVIQVPREARERAESPEIEDFAAVADPLGSRELRGRYSRAWEREAEVARLKMERSDR